MICEMCRPTNAISAWECTKKISIKQNKTKQNKTSASDTVSQSICVC